MPLTSSLHFGIMLNWALWSLCQRSTIFMAEYLMPWVDCKALIPPMDLLHQWVFYFEECCSEHIRSYIQFENQSIRKWDWSTILLLYLGILNRFLYYTTFFSGCNISFPPSVQFSTATSMLNISGFFKNINGEFQHSQWCGMAPLIVLLWFAGWTLLYNLWTASALLGRTASSSSLPAF